MILDGDRALVIRRLRSPNKGRWSLPGGGIERGETVREAIVRELHEEVNLDVSPGKLVDVVDVLVPLKRPRYHYVVAVFLVDVLGGEPRAGSDAGELKWVNRRESRRLDLTENTRAILDRFLP